MSMRYLSYAVDGVDTYGVVAGDGVVDLGRRVGAEFPTLKEFLADAKPDEREAAATQPADHALADITFLPPIADPVHIWCLALNYVEHHDEVQAAGRVQELPKQPALFARSRDSLTGHDRPLRHPGVSDQYDYEGELAVVIGRYGHRIGQDEAYDHVAGYTIMNEGSVRDWQFHTRQITPGKNFLHSGAIGPWIVSADEIGGPAEVDGLRIRTTVNGEVLQDDNAASMVHKIPRFIEYASSIAPLYPGDVLATGTPSGVGFSRKPPVFLQVGDVCEASIDRIGTLSNRVEAG